MQYICMSLDKVDLYFLWQKHSSISDTNDMEIGIALNVSFVR